MAEPTSYNADWAAAAQAGAQLLGAGLNAYMVSQTSREDRKFNERMMNQQRQWSLEDYSRVLEDSSPKAQLERLRAAGLNPNLVYGTGNVQTGVTSMPRSSELPDSHVRPFQMDLAALNVYGNLLANQLTKAQIGNINADTEKKAEETEGQALENKFNSETLVIRELLTDQQYSLAAKNMEYVDKTMANMDARLTADLWMNAEQINTLIQGRFVQWEQLQLTKEQIGASIRQGWKSLEVAAANAAAAGLTAQANMLNAVTNQVRLAKLNEKTDEEIAGLVLDNRFKLETLDLRIKAENSALNNEDVFNYDLNVANQKLGANLGVLRYVVPIASLFVKGSKK